jgi:hypothetical protein
MRIVLAALAVLAVSACQHGPDVFKPGLYYSERVDQSTFPGSWPVIPPRASWDATLQRVLAQ